MDAPATVVGIDPGTTHSGVLWFDGNRALLAQGAMPNPTLRQLLRDGEFGPAMIVIERVQYQKGSQLGPSIIDTIWWSGRFYEAAVGAGNKVLRVYWRDVRKQFASFIQPDEKKINEAVIRKRLLVKFGGEKAAKGTKKAPGPLAGVTAHAWSALALAVYWWERSTNAGVLLSYGDTAEPQVVVDDF